MLEKLTKGQDMAEAKMPGPNVLIVAPRLDIGGTEMHLARVIPQLRESGVNVSLYVIERGGALENDLVAAGVPIFGSFRKTPRRLHVVSTLFQLVMHLRRTRPDLLHFFLPRPYLIGSLAASLVGHKRRIMSRRSLTNYKRGHPMLVQLERWAHKSTLAFLANSNAVAEELSDESNDRSKIGLIHNGVVVPSLVTAEIRAAARTRLNISPETCVIAIVASLIGYKGHADLLGALARVHNELPQPWRLLVIGRDEGQGKHLARQAISLGFGQNVDWLGERSDVDAVLDTVDVAVLASHQEGFSNSLLETMGRGIPTVATAVGGNLDAIIDGDSGLLVSVRSPEDLGQALRRLCTEPELRSRLGAAGRERVRHLFSLEACVGRYENLYRSFDKIGKVPVQELIDAGARVVEPVYAPSIASHGFGSLPRVGYVPHSASYEAPGDRRRFVAYARARNLRFEFADPDERYDLVVLSESADISVWPDYQHGKVVYDLIDSYLSVPRTDLNQLLRGSAWYLLRKHKKFRPDYLTSIRQMCRRADAVVCSTEEQNNIIRQLCGNVHIILDFHSTVVKNVKTEYSSNAPFRLVWEGLSSNLSQLAEIAPVIHSLAKERAFELHVVTDAARDRLKGMLGEIDSRKFLARHFSNVVFHDWYEQTCSEIITSCDLALIPIDLDDPFVRGKPENKLLLFWRMGMPAVVSATPAYRRAMADVGTPQLACATKDQWLPSINHMLSDENARRDAAARGRTHAEVVHGPEAVLARWDDLFSSLGFSFDSNSKAA